MRPEAKRQPRRLRVAAWAALADEINQPTYVCGEVEAAGVGDRIVLRLDRIELVGLVFKPFVLSSVFAFNVVALLYRLVAIIDAYRVAEYLNASHYKLQK